MPEDEELTAEIAENAEEILLKQFLACSAVLAVQHWR